jgi:hypothetical protein
MKKRISIFSLCFFTLFSLSGQIENYQFRREIDGIADTWHTIILPSTIYKNISSGLSDLRVIGFSPEGDTIETPYILKSLEKRQTTAEIEFELINQSKINNTYYYTFEVPTKKAINQIELNFDEDNFDRQIVLEGSNNQNEWFEILSNFRVLKISNEYMQYEFATLHFPSIKYKYLRMHFTSLKKPILTSSVLKNTSLDSGTYTNYMQALTKIKTSTKDKITLLDIALGSKVPISCVAIKIKDEMDYYRPIQIEYLADSIKTEKGWIFNYSYVYSGTLSSLEPGDFCFTTILSDRLRITISNFDNQPLTIEKVNVEGNIYSLTARFNQKANYYLYYGNSNATSPNYDISLFSDKIPITLKTLSLEGEEILKTSESLASKPGLNKIWLYSLMALIVLVLGGFTLNMLRTTKQTKQ